MKAVQSKRAIIVGIFIFLGIVIFTAGVLVLGGQRKTFEKTITLNAVFNDVGGLQKGNNIWFSGVKIGTVKKLKIVSQSRVEVEMRMEQKSEDFIYKDARAKIGSDGLIGNRIIIIYGGTPGRPTVESGDTLQTDVPFNSAAMMNTLQESNKNLSAITTDFKVVSKRLAEGEGTVGKLLTDDDMARQLAATAATLQMASTNIQLLTSNLADYTSKMQKAGSLTNDLINDTILFARLKTASLQIQEASTNARELTKNLEDVSYRLRDSSNLAGVVFQDKETADNLRATVENLRAGTKKFDEDMEALQHNFLFRGFFRKRAKQQQAQQKQQEVAQTQQKSN
ncbi:MAG TPA: MlaD family protein [Chitinophagaceae bacterium]|jgi:phospholipid/cholesterol/gamma-HCH transport system substrate-binding protein|nr:MlaD family protein [Chitinophagaceae bacterium]